MLFELCPLSIRLSRARFEFARLAHTLKNDKIEINHIIKEKHNKIYEYERIFNVILYCMIDSLPFYILYCSSLTRLIIEPRIFVHIRSLLNSIQALIELNESYSRTYWLICIPI